MKSSFPKPGSPTCAVTGILLFAIPHICILLYLQDLKKDFSLDKRQHCIKAALIQCFEIVQAFILSLGTPCKGIEKVLFSKVVISLSN